MAVLWDCSGAGQNFLTDYSPPPTHTHTHARFGALLSSPVAGLFVPQRQTRGAVGRDVTVEDMLLLPGKSYNIARENL
jgi:hypothetical protein